MGAFVYARPPLTQRSFPIVPFGDSVVPPMPGASDDGQTVDVEQLLVAAVDGVLLEADAHQIRSRERCSNEKG